MSVIRFLEMVHIWPSNLSCFNCKCLHISKARHSGHMCLFFTWNQKQYFSGPEQTGFVKEGSPHWGKTVEPASVLYLCHLQPLILKITQSEEGWVEGGGKKSSIALHHFTSLSTQLSEDAQLFLCLCLMLSLLIEIFGSERKQWYTPILLYYSPLRRQMGPCLDGSHPKLQLPAFLLFLSFPFIDFFLNPPLIDLFIGCSWSTDCWEPDAPAAEALAGSARDYSHYSVRLHWALLLCATSPLVSWQSEL